MFVKFSSIYDIFDSEFVFPVPGEFFCVRSSTNLDRTFLAFNSVYDCQLACC